MLVRPRMIQRAMFARLHCALRSSRQDGSPNALQSKSSIPKLLRGIVRVDRDASNPVLPRWKVAGNFCDLTPSNKPLSIERWPGTQGDSILGNDRWLRRLQRQEEETRTEAHRQDHEIKSYSYDHERRAAPAGQWHFALQHPEGKAQVLPAPVKGENSEDQKGYSGNYLVDPWSKHAYWGHFFQLLKKILPAAITPETIAIPSVILSALVQPTISSFYRANKGHYL